MQGNSRSILKFSFLSKVLSFHKVVPPKWDISWKVYRVSKMLRACRHLLSCQFEHNELRGRSGADDRGALTLRSEVGAEGRVRSQGRDTRRRCGLCAPSLSVPTWDRVLAPCASHPTPTLCPGTGLPSPPPSASPSCVTQSFWLHWPFATWPLGFSLSSCGLVQFAGRDHCGLFQKPLPCSPRSAVRPQPLGAGASSCCVFLSIRTSYFNF